MYNFIKFSKQFAKFRLNAGKSRRIRLTGPVRRVIILHGFEETSAVDSRYRKM